MPTLGVIVGNRNFFPDHLCETGRQTVLDVLKQEGIDAGIPPKDNAAASAASSGSRDCPTHTPTPSARLATVTNWNGITLSGLSWWRRL